MNSSRIGRLKRFLASKKVDGVLVTNYLNIFYLTGFSGISTEEREAVVFVDIEKAYLFVPRLYEEQAKKFEAVRNKEVRLVVDFERSGLLTLFTKFVPKGSKVLFEEDDLRVSELEMIKKYFSGKMEKGESLIEEMRVIKDEEEVKNIRRAAEITDKTFLEIVRFLKNTDYKKLTELDLVEKIREISKSLGAEGYGFEPIVAGGKGSSMPHYSPWGRELQEGPVLFDLGLKFKGYTSDLTRTIHLGKASSRFRKIYEKVLEANMIGIKACYAGAKSEELYHRANDYFKSHCLEKYFLHGLGHGVGLNIHEEPYLRPGQKRVLKKNKTITIEPGLYFEGKFGVRIEDLVLVNEKGCEVLSKLSPKELIEI